MSTMISYQNEGKEIEWKIYMKGAAEIILKACDSMLNEKGNQNLIDEQTRLKLESQLTSYGE